MIKVRIEIMNKNTVLSTIIIDSIMDNIDSMIFRTIATCNNIIRKYKELEINIKMEYIKGD